MSVKKLRGLVLNRRLALYSSAHRCKGTKMENRDPRAGVEATSIRCPSKPAACRTMKSPIPRLSLRPVSRRVKASKIFGICSPEIPIPVSYTSIRTTGPRRLQPTTMRPPS
jgi:hypothetical protein